MRIWGIHNDQPLDLTAGNFVSIGWAELGDLGNLATDWDALKQELTTKFPGAKAGAIPVWAGIITRFVFEIQIGDLVVSPEKSTRTLNIGRITGDYFFETSADVHPNRRKVEWLRTAVPRSMLSNSALNEIGSALTLFEIRRHSSEILSLLDDALPTDQQVESDSEIADEPNASRVESYSRDFVDGVLRKMEPEQFENLIAAILRATGYHAEVTKYSGDGGVDVIASKDPLRLLPPTIKVQVKRTTNSIGGPAVQSLIGTLAPGGNEFALFVTLGNYSSDAIHIARTRQDLRLVSGTEVIDLFFEHYDALDEEWRRLIPLKTVRAVARDL